MSSHELTHACKRDTGCRYPLICMASVLQHNIHVADVLSAKLSEENPAIFVSLVLILHLSVSE